MWLFREIQPAEMEIDPTQEQFFVNEEVDRTEALVRETIQNSLDAARGGGDDPVRVRFAFSGPGTVVSAQDAARYLDGLLPHLVAAGLSPASLEHVVASEPLSYLVVEDFGTTGLDGDTGAPGRRTELHGRRSNFYDFWRRVGMSHKGGAERGRWGLGKTVYPNASRLRAFLGLTVRHDDGRQLLMGQAILRTHAMNGQLHDPYGFYAREGQSGFQEPIEEAARLRRFRQDFHLGRDEDEPGLSIVVPAPHEDITPDGILRATILHYFHPIIAGRLVVAVEGRGRAEELAAATIEEVTGRLRTPDDPIVPDRLFAFVRATLSDGLEPVEIHCPADQAIQRLSADLLDGEALETLRARYTAGELVTARLFLTIRPKGSASIPGRVDLFLQRDDSLQRGLDFYIRSGITVSGLRHIGNHAAMGLLVAADPPVARFLGDAENPAHTTWNERSESFKARYDRAVATLRLVKNSLRGVVDILARPAEGVHRDLLQDIFHVHVRDGTDSVEVPDDGPEPPVDGSVPPGPEPEPGRAPYRLARISGGFRVRRNASAEPAPCGRIRVAYEVRRGNPFRRYDPRDFNLNLPPIVITAEGVRVLRVDGNTLDFAVDEDDFTISVKGFDQRRDLAVSVTAAETTS